MTTPNPYPEGYGPPSVGGKPGAPLTDDDVRDLRAGQTIGLWNAEHDYWEGPVFLHEDGAAYLRSGYIRRGNGSVLAGWYGPLWVAPEPEKPWGTPARILLDGDPLEDDAFWMPDMPSDRTPWRLHGQSGPWVSADRVTVVAWGTVTWPPRSGTWTAVRHERAK